MSQPSLSDATATVSTEPPSVEQTLLSIYDSPYSRYTEYCIDCIPGETKQHKLDFLNMCNCCERHTTDRPTVYDYYFEYPFHDTQTIHDCKCSCRHLARIICRTFNTQIENEEQEPENDDIIHFTFGPDGSEILLDPDHNNDSLSNLYKNDNLTNIKMDLSDQIFDIKDKITDSEFKTIMETLSKIPS